MRKVGIIGNGFVGNSIAFGFSPTHDVKVHDKDSRRNMNTIEEVLECDYIFVAVPTPMHADGDRSHRVCAVSSTLCSHCLHRLHLESRYQHPLPTDDHQRSPK